MRAGLPQPVNTPELRFDCPDARKFGVVEEVKARLTKAGAKFSDIDGVRVSTKDGWWLLRASNTQPVLVARCEAPDEAGPPPAQAGHNAALSDGGRHLPAVPPERWGTASGKMTASFLAGTLLDQDVRALVTGRRRPPSAFVPATLKG